MVTPATDKMGHQSRRMGAAKLFLRSSYSLEKKKCPPSTNAAVYDMPPYGYK